jgi:DNA-3-methyladenine glycosylase
MTLSPLPPSFYDRPAPAVARDLLGMRLVRLLAGQRLAGIILETEAYQGEEDLACHARGGRTRRTVIMYGPPGRAYVYFTYGMHWMLNCVTGGADDPAAVLIRAIWPVEGLAQIRHNHPDRPPERCCDGPAKLCRALAIDGRLNGIDLTTTEAGLWIEPGQPIPDAWITVGPRVGISRVPEPWRSIPWRFLARLPQGLAPTNYSR